MTDRDERATAIRDHVLRLMKKSARSLKVGSTPMKIWEQGAFAATVHGPIAVDTLPPAVKTKPWIERSLPCYMSVRRAGAWVLSIEWDPAGFLRTIHFAPGDWERELMALR